MSTFGWVVFTEQRLLALVIFVRRHGDLDKNIAGRTIFLRSYRHVRRNMLNEVLIPPKLMEPGKNLGLLKLKIWSEFQIWWIHVLCTLDNYDFERHKTGGRGFVNWQIAIWVPSYLWGECGHCGPPKNGVVSDLNLKWNLPVRVQNDTPLSQSIQPTWLK